MQCRGEWKLARVTSGVSAMRVFRATFQSPLQLRGGALRLFTGCYRCMQCRGEWKLARVTSGVSAMRVFRATSQSPLQLRGGALWLFTGCYWWYIQLRGVGIAVIYRVLSVMVYTCSVGASACLLLTPVSCLFMSREATIQLIYPPKEEK